VELKMPEFKSPLGTKQFQGQPMRDISVPDESGPPQQQQRRHRHEEPVFDERAMRDFQAQMEMQNQPPPQAPVRELNEVEREMLAAKKAKREGKERLSDGARRRIEMLLGMIRLHKDIEIDGQLYRVRTLASEELREAIVGAAEFDGSVQFIFEMRRQILARSLVVVAGVEVDQFLNSYELEDRLNFIEALDHALLIRLYNEYTELTQQAQNKYSPKTDAQVKEVLEDLKK
jgi:cell division protein ZapA (FtsZ GTPase activity inhibitor)